VVYVKTYIVWSDEWLLDSANCFSFNARLP
jgi:hypothetical protein